MGYFMSALPSYDALAYFCNWNGVTLGTGVDWERIGWRGLDWT